jgi:hypothetical protein
MEADQLQRVWQSQECGRQITVDADLVLKLVRRNYRNFRSNVFWGDVREVGIAVILVAFFAYQGVLAHLWPLFVMAAACAWVGLFILGDRLRMKWKTPTPGETLVAWTESSLASVEHRTWLCKNVFWSCLLPFWIGCALFAGYLGFRTWGAQGLGWGWKTGMYALFVGCMLVPTAACYGAYWLNQRYIRTDLQPRKQELQTLLENLKASD